MQPPRHWFWLIVIIVISLFVLAKGADLLVKEAVALSTRWGVPTVVIGATIVSLGTTMPEAAISVLAAFKGEADLALGNAVGSIICDTGLILGLCAVIAPLPLDPKLANRQGWLQLGAGFLLVISTLPFSRLGTIFVDGGRMPQFMGFVFLLLLAVYIWQSIKWSSGSEGGEDLGEFENKDDEGASATKTLLKLIIGLILVVGSSWILIPAVMESAIRVKIPQSIIAATLVAFGTSLPELVTCVTAIRQGHGELAVGNIIGADILNVLFVAGASAAVTTTGLAAPPQFYRILFPAMLVVLVVFRIGIFISGTHLKRPFGFVLLAVYLLAFLVSLGNS